MVFRSAITRTRHRRINLNFPLFSLFRTPKIEGREWNVYHCCVNTTLKFANYSGNRVLLLKTKPFPLYVFDNADWSFLNGVKKSLNFCNKVLAFVCLFKNLFEYKMFKLERFRRSTCAKVSNELNGKWDTIWMPGIRT